MPNNLTPEQIKAILTASNINSLDDLVNQLSLEQENSPVGSVSRELSEGAEVAATSWIIRAIRLSRELEDLEINEIPQELMQTNNQ